MRLEIAQQIVRARVLGHLCEGCGRYGTVEVHHRLARGMGGVSRAAADHVNDPRNMLALCAVPCHAATEHADTWRECEAKGWRFRHGVESTHDIPALIYTTQGRAWWLLGENGTYTWQDKPLEYRITLEATRGTDGQGTAADHQEHQHAGLADEGGPRP